MSDNVIQFPVQQHQAVTDQFRLPPTRGSFAEKLRWATAIIRDAETGIEDTHAAIRSGNVEQMKKVRDEMIRRLARGE